MELGILGGSLLEFCSVQCCWFAGPQWPRGLRRRSAAARLLRLWLRIPLEACLSVVSVVCCQVEVSAASWSLVQRSPTDCCASLCVIWKTLEWGGHGPLWAVAPEENKMSLADTDIRRNMWTSWELKAVFVIWCWNDNNNNNNNIFIYCNWVVTRWQWLFYM